MVGDHMGILHAVVLLPLDIFLTFDIFFNDFRFYSFTRIRYNRKDQLFSLIKLNFGRSQRQSILNFALFQNFNFLFLFYAYICID